MVRDYTERPPRLDQVTVTSPKRGGTTRWVLRAVVEGRTRQVHFDEQPNNALICRALNHCLIAEVIDFPRAIQDVDPGSFLTEADLPEDYPWSPDVRLRWERE